MRYTIYLSYVDADDWWFDAYCDCDADAVDLALNYDSDACVIAVTDYSGRIVY